jgi:RNA polymerase sigma-70 factor (ECF subfamily)
MGLTGYMHTDPDIQLMLQFKAGDQRAFQHLFDKHKKRVINYCYRYCGHPAVAEELAQETFLRVYKAAPRYRPKARFSTWLFKIAANVCLNEIRKPIYRNRMESMDEAAEKGCNPVAAPCGPGASAPDAMLASREQQTVVQKAIAQLPEKQRAALLLRVNEEFSYREIGRQINRSEGHVKTLIHRGRQRLKKMLGAYFGEGHEKSL